MIKSDTTSPIQSIVIIDDNTVLLEELSEVIESAGYTCHIFSDEVKAVNVLRFKVITADLVIVDINLNLFSGLSVVQMLKSMPHIRSVPFVVMTAYYQDPADLVKSSGVQAVLIKPIAPKVLLKTIMDLLSSEKVRQEPGKLKVTQGDRL